MASSVFTVRQAAFFLKKIYRSVYFMIIPAYICRVSKTSRTSAKPSGLPVRTRTAGQATGFIKPAKEGASEARKGERTREFIRERAAPLFNKQGFAGTSLGDLTEATGLTKGALYGNFKDKEGIALEAFAYSMQQIRVMMRSRVDPLPTYKQKLLALVEFFGEYVMHPPIPGGCPMMNYGVEADDSQRFMKKSVAREMQSTILFIQRCLDQGVAGGEFRSSVDTAVVAQVIFCAIEGAIVVSRVKGSPAPMAAVVEYCKSILDQLT
jgi:AcrR family transcriptional regulator